MIRPLHVLLLVAALLPGCAQTAKYKTYPPSPPPVAYEPEVTVSSTPEELDRKVPPVPARRPEVAAAPEAASGQPKSEQPKIEWLLGRDFEAVQALLGDPALKEIQAPASVWAYNGSGCVLNIFFYPHIGGGGYQALTYEVRGGEPSPEEEKRCFSELVMEQEKAEAD